MDKNEATSYYVMSSEKVFQEMKRKITGYLGLDSNGLITKKAVRGSKAGKPLKWTGVWGFDIKELEAYKNNLEPVKTLLV